MILPPLVFLNVGFKKGLCTLAEFVGENVEQCDRNRKDPICVTLPKVAKPSSIVTVTCCCRWHYRAKTSLMETWLSMDVEKSISCSTAFYQYIC